MPDAALAQVVTPNVRRRPGVKLDPETRDAILADIGRGKESYVDISKRYGVSSQTVAVMARKRGLPSPFSPRLMRTEAANRALAREAKAHAALKGTNLSGLHPDDLSKIAERASTSLHSHLAALEKADQPSVSITIAPELRLLAVAFMGASQGHSRSTMSTDNQIERNVTPEISGDSNVT